MEIDWVRKITSRKFWMAVVGFICGILTLKGVGAEQVEKIGGLILMGASVVAYIIGEGLADSGSCEIVNQLSEEDTQKMLDALRPPDEDEDE